MQFIGTFIGILVLFVFSLFMYFYAKDIIDKSLLLKSFTGLVIFANFLLLITFLYLNVYVETNKVCSPEKYEISDNEKDITETITNSKQVHSINWNLPFKNRENYKFGEFCFYYNNSNSNFKKINLVYENQIFTNNQIYILNNTYGNICIEFNSSLLKNGMIMGLSCENCNVTNTLELGQDIDNSKIMELESGSPNISYVAELDYPHIYSLKLYQNCYLLMETYFQYFMMIFAIFILLFWGIMLIKKFNDYHEDINKK